MFTQARRRLLAMFIVILAIGALAFGIATGPVSADCRHDQRDCHDNPGSVTPVVRQFDRDRDLTQRVAFVDPCSGRILDIISVNERRAFVNRDGASFFPFFQQGSQFLLQPQLAQFVGNTQFVMLANGNVVPVGSDFLSGFNGTAFSLGNTIGLGIPVVFAQPISACVPPTVVPPQIIVQQPQIIQQAPAPQPAPVVAAPVLTIRPPQTGDAGLRSVIDLLQDASSPE